MSYSHSLLMSLLRKLEVDRAVFFGLLSKLWSVAAGPVSVLLIASKFTAELQGYYYTFSNLLALQVFVELGLGTVIIQFASHEWSKLSLDNAGQIIGDKESLSRLVSIARITLRWYLTASLIVVLGLGLGGYIFFSRSSTGNISWLKPWLSLCILTGGTICLTPLWSLLEGCNQVSTVYTFRFWQGLLTTSATWIAIILGAGLWTAIISTLSLLTCDAIFLRYKFFNFIKSLMLSSIQGARISWSKDLLPMQWRIALSWVSGYFVFSFFTPVLFKYHGPIVAGQMGMTWGVVGLLGTIAGVWLAPKVPQFGMLIAQRKYKELDKLFWRMTKITICIAILLGTAGWLCIYGLYTLKFRLASRLLSPLPAGLFILAQLVMIASIPFSYYMRAHKQEPLMFISAIAAILTGLSTLILGKHFSATGMAVGYLAVNMTTIPFIFVIWNRRRKEWHKETAA